jgi:hypothetical protein
MPTQINMYVRHDSRVEYVSVFLDSSRFLKTMRRLTKFTVNAMGLHTQSMKR